MNCTYIIFLNFVFNLINFVISYDFLTILHQLYFKRYDKKFLDKSNIEIKSKIFSKSLHQLHQNLNEFIFYPESKYFS